MITFTVTGDPASQGSHVGFVAPNTGRVVVKQQNGAKHRTWRSEVKHEATEAMAGAPALDEPVWLTVVFRLPRPKKSKFGDWPAGRPDADKMLRAVFDAMTGVIYADDARIVACTVEKVWTWAGGGPGCTITVETLADRMESVFGGGGA